MSAKHAEEVFKAYWSLYRCGVLPLISSVLVAAEIRNADWAEVVEGYIAEVLA